MLTLTVRQARWLLFPTLLALWPAWVRQVKYSVNDFPIGLVILAAACAWWVIEQRRVDSRQIASHGFLVVGWFGLVCYALTYGRIPPLGSQVLATLILACGLLAPFPRELARVRIAYLALIPLTLPVEMALQFVLGFPFRRVSAEIAAVLLSPYGVTVDGTTLYYGQNPLEVDAACSGILGLWAFLLVAAGMSLLLRLRWTQMLLTFAVAGVASLFYNVVRTSLLFMYRFHSGTESTTMHSLIGAMAFVVALSVFTLVALRWFRRKPSVREGLVAA